MDFSAVHVDALMVVARLKKSLKKLPSWRPQPQRSAPGDAPRISVMPTWHYRPQRGGGLELHRGDQDQEVQAPELERAIYLLRRAICAVGRAPAAWHQATREEQ
eukprot:8236762-Pyramimonas_sp.AAC.1